MQPLILLALLAPGDSVCHLAGVPARSDRRRVVRSVASMGLGRTLATGAAVGLMV